MKPKFPVIAGQIDVPGNDDKHNFTDPNLGGGPRATSSRVAPARRGGFGQHGQRSTMSAPMGGGRGSAGNPAARGGASIGSMNPDKAVPGHGGSPHARGGSRGNFDGGFGGPSGQRGVPSARHADPKPAAGNTRGKSYQMIAGRFKRAAMGARPSTGSGKYGSAPVSANT